MKEQERRNGKHGQGRDAPEAPGLESKAVQHHHSLAHLLMASFRTG